MSQKRRLGHTDELTASPAPVLDTPAARRGAPRWKWRTFPVYFAFATGLLIAALLNTETDNAFEGAVQIAALLLFGYGIAHLIIRNVAVAGRARKRGAPPGDRGENEDEWEDVIVHPDEAPPPR